VTSDETNTEWLQRRHFLVRDLVHVAHYIHQRAYDLHATPEVADLNAITQREIEALKWAADGKTIEDIAIIMGISSETVKAHLDSARRKLSALNRTHAAVKALRTGLIS
jgi:DNA-binding CsgD family transcriptional regulator